MSYIALSGEKALTDKQLVQMRRPSNILCLQLSDLPFFGHKDCSQMRSDLAFWNSELYLCSLGVVAQLAAAQAPASDLIDGC